MTDRRSHWDTDLIEGVGRRLIPLYRSIGYCTDAERHRIYTLIEFVEDWQDRTQQARAMSMTDNEAAIARVRELLDAADGFTPPLVLTTAELRRALDGDSEDALVTNTILAMMRPEDAPLIDPDCRDGKHSSCVGGPCQCPCHELAAS